jgi:hypothetical protein
MAKQSLKDPKFRCNVCKDYHYAPEYKTMYQCASHGIMCEKVVVTKDTEVNLKFGGNLEFTARSVKFPLNYINFCNLDGNTYFTKIRKEIHLYDQELVKNNLSISSKDEEIINFRWNTKFLFPKKNQPDTYGCRKTIKYDWSDDLKMWIEEGKEIVEKSVSITEKSNKSSEIKLLIDLFEKDILTKEQFLSQMKSIV